jgi:hypothetical protein
MTFSGVLADFEGLAAANIAVHSFDCHGHGKSEPAEDYNRALINRYDDLVSLLIILFVRSLPFIVGEKAYKHTTMPMTMPRERLYTNTPPCQKTKSSILCGQPKHPDSLGMYTIVIYF